MQLSPSGRPNCLRGAIAIGATALAASRSVEQLTGGSSDRSVEGAETALLLNEAGVGDAVTVSHVLTTAEAP